METQIGQHEEKLEADGCAVSGSPSVGQCDPNETPQAPTTKPLSFHLAFLSINIVVLLFSLDATSLSVALPIIAEELNGTSLESFWAGIAYLLAVVVAQPLYTSVSDVLGRKGPFIFAFIVFFAGSIVFALAQNMTGVIAGRVVQGLGGAGLDVLGEVIAADIVPLKDRSKYLGIMAIPTAAGSVLGPSVGALFCQYVSWRWIGWINLPLLVIAFPLAFFFLRLQVLPSSLSEKVKRLDWGGMGLFTVGCTIFVLPLSWADSLYPWSSWRTLLPLFLGLVILAVFAVYESRPQAPVFPHRLFRSKTLVAALCSAFFHGMNLYCVMQYLPLFFQAVALQSYVDSAVSLLPTSVASVLGAGISVTIVGFIKNYRWPIWTSWVLVVLGCGLLVLIDQTSSRAMRDGLPIIWGAGIGALLRVLHLPTQAGVSHVDDMGLAIGMLMVVRLFGGLAGLAIGSTVFSSVFNSSINQVTDLVGPLAVLGNGSQAAIEFIPQLRQLYWDGGASKEALEAVIGVYLQSMRAIFYTMTGFGGLGFLISFFMDEISLQSSDLGRQKFDS